MLLGVRCGHGVVTARAVIVRFTDSARKFGKQRAATLLSAQLR
jgi:hypothetical protein